MKARQLIIKNLERQRAIINDVYRESENRRVVQKYKSEVNRLMNVITEFRDLGDN